MSFDEQAKQLLRDANDEDLLALQVATRYLLLFGRPITRTGQPPDAKEMKQ